MAADLIPQEAFDKVVNGRRVTLINLTNSLGTVVQITNYGARIVSFLVKDRSGKTRDIVIGHGSIDGYLNSKERFFNAVIGRYANRIAGGTFLLDGKKQQVTVNNGINHLHGGNQGLNEQVWEVVKLSSSRAKLSCVLKDGLDGYKGNLEVTVKYFLTEKNEFVIDYLAKCDQNTVINLTNHAFFNLCEDHTKTILSNKLFIAASAFTPLNGNMIPNGRKENVKNTPFDFTSFKAIGKDIGADEPMLKTARGYDLNYVLDGYPAKDGAPFFAATLIEPSTGLRLEIYTDQPGLQLYTGNFLEGKDTGKGGVCYKEHTAVCLETQHFPDSPNRPRFPSVYLAKGEEFKSCTIYKVSADAL